jgi:hypothetical protein
MLLLCYLTPFCHFRLARLDTGSRAVLEYQTCAGDKDCTDGGTLIESVYVRRFSLRAPDALGVSILVIGVRLLSYMLLRFAANFDTKCRF